MIKIINTGNETLAILQNVVSPFVFEEINRGFTFSFSTVIDNDKSSHVNYQNRVEVEDNWFNIIYAEEERTLEGLFIRAECEHVSYDLISANFTAGFTATGLFSAVATTVLSGTGFSIGTVTVTGNETISIKEPTNARQIILSMASVWDAELEWDKYQINALTRRGADRGVQFRYRKNLVGVKRIVDNRTKTDAGLPTISYQISPAELEFEQGFIDAGLSDGEHFELGDDVRVIDEDLSLDISLRIVKEGHDPEQRMIGQVEIANFVDDLADTLTQIQTTSVSKNAIYNGVSIGPDDGFVAERSDELVKTDMNATNGIEIDLRDSTTASYTAVFYVQIDTATGTAKLYLAGNAVFTGEVIASDFVGGTITIGTGSNAFNANGTDGIWLGATAFATAPFSSTLSGALTAQNAQITGDILAGSTFTVATGSNTIRADSSGFYVGSSAFATAPFRVTLSGSATATDLNITGVILNVGTGTNTFQFNTTDGLFLGNTAVASAPFSVTMSGAATMVGATIKSAGAGSTRMELTPSGLISYNSSNQLHGVSIAASGSMQQLSFYHNGSFVGDLVAGGGGTGLLLSVALGNTLFLGIAGTTTSLLGTWDFGSATIQNLDTDTHNQGNHNHGIPNGTVLLTATGNETWVESGGFGHSHTVV